MKRVVVGLISWVFWTFLIWIALLVVCGLVVRFAHIEISNTSLSKAITMLCFVFSLLSTFLVIFRNRIGIKWRISVVAAIGIFVLFVIFLPNLNIHPKAGQEVAKSQSGLPSQDPHQSPQFQLSLAEIDSLKVEQIAVDDNGILFLLDNSGHVWGFSRKPIENSNVIYPLIRLPNLSGIKQIAPYIALDNSGNVFTWSHASNPASPPFSMPVQYMGIQNVTSIFPESLAVEVQLDGIEDHPSISIDQAQ